MKRISLLLIVVLLILGGCSKTEIKKVEDLKADYEADKTKIESSSAYIDMLLLEENKNEAYTVLKEAYENAQTDEDRAKLKEFTKYLPIRLIEKDVTYDDKLTDIAYTRYDKDGRIIMQADTSRIYPDDGGDVYYYTLDSWTDYKTCYDKEDRIVAQYSNSYSYYKNEDPAFKPYSEEFEIARLYKYEFDDKGNDIKIVITTQSKDVTYEIETHQRTFDENSNLLMDRCTFTYVKDDRNITYYNEYEYDQYGNVIKSTYKYEDGDASITEYKNNYDEKDRLIRKETSTEYYNDIVVYSYDELYDVVLEENNEKDVKSKTTYKYELVTPDAEGIGLYKDAITFASGNATKAVTQRKIVASNIKVRKEPTVHKENKIRNVKAGDIVDVYDSVYGGGYIWYEIGLNEWIADDGTWTEAVN